MKRCLVSLVSLVLVMVTLFSVPMNALAQDTTDRGEYRLGYANVKSTLNLRKKASADSKSIHKIEHGELLYVISKKGKFYYVETVEDGLTGYVAASYVVIPEAPFDPASHEGSYAIVSTEPGSWLNVRSAASRDAEILSTIYCGTIVEIIPGSYESGFYKVITLDGNIGGYCSADYLTRFTGMEFISAAVNTQNSSSKNRNTNMAIACRTINTIGAFIKPGETFNWIDVVGHTTTEKGYKTAPVMKSDGSTEPGLGGGVCQVATTLYDAVEKTHVKIVERHLHAKPVHYARTGREATVSADAGVNFRFKNTLSYPIYIVMIANDNRVICQVFRVIEGD